MSSCRMGTGRPPTLESGSFRAPAGENEKLPEQKDRKLQGKPPKLVVNC